MKRAAENAEAHVNALTERLRDLDERIAAPGLFEKDPRKGAQLLKERGLLSASIEEAEGKWLAAEEAYDGARAAAS
ncbi:MAG: hypothetical protein U1E87_09345 [Alphaproteobacteria bacterium]